MGRPSPSAKKRIAELLRAGKLSNRAIAAAFAVDERTIRRMAFRLGIVDPDGHERPRKQAKRCPKCGWRKGKTRECLGCLQLFREAVASRRRELARELASGEALKVFEEHQRRKRRDV